MAKMKDLPYTRFMADTLHFDTKVSSEGRIVLPAVARAALGLKPGDRVHITVQDGEATLVSAQALLEDIWAHNPAASEGGDHGRVTVQQSRDEDERAADAKRERVSRAVGRENRSESQIAADLFASLGIDR